MLQGYDHGNEISKEDFFKLNCNVIIPSALELQIDKIIAEGINCDLVIEAANGPIDNEAEDILEAKGIPIIPDILANSGGVLVSYYEWLQNKRDEYWEEKDVKDKFDEKIIESNRHKDVESHAGKRGSGKNELECQRRNKSEELRTNAAILVREGQQISRF